MQSMTGFGSKEVEMPSFGKISVELRSTNHKFLETVFHLPEGFLCLEDKIKKEIEIKIKRGRLVCAITINGSRNPNVFINKALLKSYIATLDGVKKQFHIKEGPSIDTLVHLPGVLSLGEHKIQSSSIWPKLRVLVKGALDELVKTRKKEGKATYVHLKVRAGQLQSSLEIVKARFKKALKDKLNAFNTDEERASFLKDTDVSEEIERLAFHIKNFKNKISKSEPIGKELDFIAQEMQREANTLAAKTFDVAISGRVVQMKGQIEKIREQAQNIE